MPLLSLRQTLKCGGGMTGHQGWRGAWKGPWEGGSKKDADCSLLSVSHPPLPDTVAFYSVSTVDS